jgi:hypothetical protein
MGSLRGGVPGLPGLPGGSGSSIISSPGSGLLCLFPRDKDLLDGSLLHRDG